MENEGHSKAGGDAVKFQDAQWVCWLRRGDVLLKVRQTVAIGIAVGAVVARGIIQV